MCDEKITNGQAANGSTGDKCIPEMLKPESYPEQSFSIHSLARGASSMASKVEVLESQQPALRIASTTLPAVSRCDSRGNPVENRVLLEIPDHEFELLYRHLQYFEISLHK